MTTEEQAWTLLVEANPIPDLDAYEAEQVNVIAYLATLEARSSDMTELEQGSEHSASTQPTVSPRTTKWRNGMIAAAAAVAVLIAVGVVAAVVASRGTPVSTADQPTEQATTIPSTTPVSTADREFTELVATVEAMVAAHNSGNFDVWRAYFPAQRPIIWADTVETESDLDWQRSYMAANEVWTITGPCRPPGRAAGGVSCPMTVVNDFLRPAGLFYTGDITFRFNDRGEIAVLASADYEIAGSVPLYTQAFDAWLQETHPDIHASFGPRVDGMHLPSAADMPVALKYVDDFIAQSDLYPLDAGN